MHNKKNLSIINEKTFSKSKLLTGFTLLELLIYVAILAILTVGIASAFLSVNRGRGQVEARSETNTNLQFAIEKISRDLKSASSVTTPATAGSSSDTLVMTLSGSTITYSVSSGQLKRQVNSETPETITSDKVTVATPTFTRLENTNTVLNKTVVSIEIDITMSYNSTSPDYQYSERKKTTAALR